MLVAIWLTQAIAGTNPIHNKKPKKKATEEDEDDKAYKLKAAAGTDVLHCCENALKTNYTRL